jgi:hypothetical protein
MSSMEKDGRTQHVVRLWSSSLSLHKAGVDDSMNCGDPVVCLLDFTPVLSSSGSMREYEVTCCPQVSEAPKCFFLFEATPIELCSRRGNANLSSPIQGLLSPRYLDRSNHYTLFADQII